MTLRQALQVSCDTWFYAFAANEFYADQARVDAGQKPNEYLQRMAAAYGVGTAPGVDLPADEQAAGSYADRETRLARWKANKTQYCADAERGFPHEADPAQRAFLTQLAAENCTDGWRYRAGDNADMAIGQGETTVSPLQLAVAYSALVNGGTIWRPTLGRAVVDAAGRVVRRITPTAKGKVPVSRATLDYIANSLHFEPRATPCPARSPSTALRTRRRSVARPARPRSSASRTRPGSRRGARSARTRTVTRRRDSWSWAWSSRRVPVPVLRRRWCVASMTGCSASGEPPSCLDRGRRRRCPSIGVEADEMTLLARDPVTPLTLRPPIARRRVRTGIDWLLVAAALALALIGAVLVWSATRSRLAADGADPQGYLYRHLVNVAIGLALAAAASRADARMLRLFGPIVYVVSLLGLAAVFVVGSTVNGSRAWILLPGGLALQPSEFMKLGLIVGMAVMFGHRASSRRDGVPPTGRDVSSPLSWSPSRSAW